MREHAPHRNARFRRGRAAAGALGGLLALVLVAGCSGAPTSATAVRSFVAMDTTMTLTAVAPNQKTADEATQACEARVRELDALLAPARPESDIARLNAAGVAPVVLSDSTSALLASSLDAARQTEGAFDPTVYPLTSAWGFTDGSHRLPAPDEIASLLNRVGFAHATVDGATNAAQLKGGAQIDVGGVAKGFAADQLSALLPEAGVTSALLDLGGNITAIGTKPDGRPWSIGIADPFAPDQIAGSLELRDATLSTSGDYQRFFIDADGIKRHHLIDPATGYPAASDLASVSVVSASGVRADALSTALYVMGPERALEFCAKNATGADAIQAVLITKDGTIHLSAGLADIFSPNAAYAQRVVVHP